MKRHGRGDGQEMMKRKKSSKGRCCNRKKEGVKILWNSVKGRSRNLRRRSLKVRKWEETEMLDDLGRRSKLRKGRVLRKQARKARAAHLVSCTLLPGMRLKELYINSRFSENRDD